MKTEQEIKDIFDGFIKTVKDNMDSSSRIFHKYDRCVGWSRSKPSDLHKLEEYLRMYRDLMAMKDTAEMLKKMIFGEDKKEESE